MAHLPLSPLESVINGYLRLDPDVEVLLEPLVDKTVGFTIAPFGIEFFVCFTEDRVQLVNQLPQAPDCHIRGTPSSLFMMQFSDDKKGLFKGDVTIDGDTDVATQAKQFFDRLDIDWEEHLSHLVGDPIAHGIGGFIRKLCGWGKSTRNTMKSNLTEYMQEEIRYFPPRQEIEDFMDDVDSLRNSVERLALRVARLQQEQP
ncbi:MAG: sterol-binding protein [Legionellales bacterium]|nr:sterol-binding protein [Legionellales bacterium]|tara:strand:+ start:38179 stop:38781 length:603 start_codon:yes stop_codon:yes gene_type:complete